MNIVIVGDTLLDKDISDSAARLSPDGPVPVLDVNRIRYRPGGAGLVAALLARDDTPMRIQLVTVLSDDAPAHQLRSALEIATRGRVEIIAGPSGAPTPVKTRIRSGSHPVARIDEGCGPPPIPEATAAMCETISRADVLLVADYGRGITSNPRIRTALRRRARQVPLVWDPHPSGGVPVPETAVVTPNLREAAGLVGSAEAFDTAFVAGPELRERWGCAAVAVTAGERGVVLSNGRDPLHLPARCIENADPCGAGDRFAATVARVLGTGAQLPDALFEATIDTAAYLREGGVARIDTALDFITTGPRDAITLAVETRAHGGTVVATGGCFDLMHAGHARTLAGARALGDCLIVCLNSDSSVRRLKGQGRPLMPEADRIELLLSLGCVDAVAVFEESTPERVLRQLRPDVWVKGGDYTPETLPEASVLAEWGGRVEVRPLYYGRSTTNLVNAIERAS